MLFMNYFFSVFKPGAVIFHSSPSGDVLRPSRIPPAQRAPLPTRCRARPVSSEILTTLFSQFPLSEISGHWISIFCVDL